MRISRTFKWGSAEIAVQRSTVRDRMAAEVIASELYADGDTRVDTHGKNTFARFVQRSDIKGDLGFPFPARTASAPELFEGLEAFLDMDEDLYVRWEDELRAVNVPLNNPALTPTAAQTDPNEPAPSR